MKTIGQLLETKGHEIWSLPPDASVFEAITLMAEKEIGALLILEDGEAVGVLSERDYARKVILAGRSSRETRVREIMTEDVIFVDASESVEEGMARMTTGRMRHLPVLEEGELIGIVSIGDLVKSIISDQQFLIEQLENYVSG